jgi:hypothetical protein
MPIWQQAGGLPKHWRTLHLALADGDEVNQVNGTHRYLLLFNNTDYMTVLLEREAVLI